MARILLQGMVLFALATSHVACRRGPTPYRSAMNAAEEARRGGHFDQERAHFEEATRRAKKPKDESEARYRRAESWVREGNYSRGATELEKFARDFPSSIRAARAWLDAGRAWEKAGEKQRACDAYERVVEQYPESGNADGAAKTLVALRTESEGAPAHQIWRQLLERNRSKTLDEVLRYRHARALEEVSPRDAVLAYEDVARHHPLPRGSYTDEALLRAAQLRRAGGDGEGALRTLDLLLEQGGKAAFVGSYTRTAYIDALLLRGRILRDDLHRLEEAKRAFESLPEKHPHSRLVDDALWESIITLKMQGRDECAGMKALEKASPKSRYVRCHALFCKEGALETQTAEKCVTWLEGID